MTPAQKTQPFERRARRQEGAARTGRSREAGGAGGVLGKGKAAHLLQARVRQRTSYSSELLRGPKRKPKRTEWYQEPEVRTISMMPATPAESTGDGHGACTARSIHLRMSDRSSSTSAPRQSMAKAVARRQPTCNSIGDDTPAAAIDDTPAAATCTPRCASYQAGARTHAASTGPCHHSHVTPPTSQKSRSPLWQMKTSTVRRTFSASAPSRRAHSIRQPPASSPQPAATTRTQ